MKQRSSYHANCVTEVGASACIPGGQQIIFGGSPLGGAGANLQAVNLERRVKNMDLMDYSAMLASLGFMVWIGFCFARKQKTIPEN